MVNQYSNPWTDDEVTILQNYYEHTSNAELAELIPRHNARAIWIYANRMNLLKNCKHRSKMAALTGNWKHGINQWTKTELTMLYAFYPDGSKEELLLMFSERNWNAIQSKAHKLGIKRHAHRALRSQYMKTQNPMFNLEWRNKQRQNTPRGQLSANWRGGSFLDFRGGLSRDNWDSLRRKVYVRDGYRCQDCGITHVPLDVHHIMPWRFSYNNSLDNLIALCHSCHTKRERRT